MTDKSEQTEKPNEGSSRLLYWLSLLFVVIGLLNVTPSIPGWDDAWKTMTTWDQFKIRRFPTEWFYPIVFFWMMLIVALKHSIWRAWSNDGVHRKSFGLALDMVFVLAALTISLSYLIELEAVCLIDQFTGDRVRLVAQALQSEIDLATMMGLPIPETVDDPKCLNNTGGWLPMIVFCCVITFLIYNVRVWGLPLVLVSILIATYTFGTVLSE